MDKGLGVKRVKAPSVGAGRPKGSKDHIPDKFCKGMAGTNDIRQMLTEAFKKNSDDIMPRLFKELKTLEGYAYISGVNVILKQILPALQSVEFNANIKEEKSYLLKKVLELQQDSKN